VNLQDARCNNEDMWMVFFGIRSDQLVGCEVFGSDSRSLLTGQGP